MFFVVDNLRVSHGRVVAVRDASFEVTEGEFVGLVGSNGAGKSSMFNAISGVIPWSSGDVLFQGRSLRNMRPEHIVRLGVSIVPEGRQVFGQLTVEENLRLAARTTKNADRDAEARMYDRFEILDKYRKNPASQLSGGEQQMLVIARALLTGPQLLLLDEPTLGLAPKVVDQVFQILQELREEGTTILLAEQNAARTIAAADRTLVMAKGVLDTFSPTGGGREVEEIVARYLGRRREAGGG